MIVLTNTETKQKEKIEPPADGRPLTLYTCGPTVYAPAHIGNLRTFVAEDLLKRTLLFLSIPVTHCMNITDVDDKTIQGAIIAKEPFATFTEKYTSRFLEDLKKLHILPADHLPRATAYIPAMIALIEELLKQKVAYKGEDGNVFFRIAAFPTYGRLSHLPIERLKAGASERTHQDEYDKDDVSDFVLWKSYNPQRDGDVFWESPFGKGRPGWHIECSAMAMEILGQTIDIHCGGIDNIFPHHDNEIAQSEACTHKQFVRHWFHCAHLIVEGKKMSKSLGNIYTLDDLIAKGCSLRAVRYLLLSVHYQMPLNFTWEGVKGAEKAIERIAAFLDRLQTIEHPGPTKHTKIHTKADLHFRQALADDLNISEALAVLFDYIRTLNTLIDENTLALADAAKALALWESWNRVLAIDLAPQAHSISAHILELFQQREAARKAKDWKNADRLRQEIEDQGFTIEDHPSGSKLRGFAP